MCIFILCQRERKRHWGLRKARPCVLCFRAVDHFILEGRRSWVSKHHNDCVRGEICFKKIVSNTRLDLNHLSFTRLVCEFLIICKFLLIYTISIYCFCLLHLFVLLLIFRSECCSFLFNHKSKLLKYIQHKSLENLANWAQALEHVWQD